MEPKRFYSQNFSLLIVKYKKLGLSAPLSVFSLDTATRYRIESRTNVLQPFDY